MNSFSFEAMHTSMYLVRSSYMRFLWFLIDSAGSNYSSFIKKKKENIENLKKIE